jgi:Ca2+-binding EF-hand superfamily protein
MWMVLNSRTQMSEKEAKKLYEAFRFYFVVLETTSEDDVGFVYAFADSDESWEKLSEVVDKQELKGTYGAEYVLECVGDIYGSEKKVD